MPFIILVALVLSVIRAIDEMRNKNFDVAFWAWMTSLSQLALFLSSLLVNKYEYLLFY